MLSTAGDTQLGGDDFDQAVIDWMVDAFHAQTGVELTSDPTVLQRLKNAAESAKRDLSFHETTRANVPFIAGTPTGPVHLDLELSRSEYESIVGPLLERTREPCETALADASLRPGDLDVVLLVGGQTRSPCVQERAREYFDRTPVKGVNPDEAVALGAAVTAGLCKGEVKNVSLVDVNPLSLGIETYGGSVSVLIPRNTSIPTTAKKTFTTQEDHQVIIRVHAVQGERQLASENRTLGIFELLGVRPAPRGETQIEIEFEIDENGIVHVTASDLGTGLSQRVRITDAGGFSDQEIERILSEAERHRATDEAARVSLELRNKSTQSVHSARRLLDQDGTIPAGLRDRIGRAIRELDEGLEIRTDDETLGQLHQALLDLLAKT